MRPSARLSSGRSRGLHKTVGQGIHAGYGPLVLHFVIDDDAAGHRIAIPLRDNVGCRRRSGGLQGQRPRQSRTVDTLRLGVQVQIVDVGIAARAEDLIPHHFGVERLRVLAEYHRSFHDAFRAEEGAGSADREAADDDHDHDEQRNPESLENADHWIPPGPVGCWIVGEGLPEGVTRIRVADADAASWWLPTRYRSCVI